MSKNQRIISQKKSVPKVKNLVGLRAVLDIEMFLISKEKLEQLTDYTNDTVSFSLVLFYFSIAIGICVTLFTTTIKNQIVFNAMAILAAVFFTIGLLKLKTHAKNRKRIVKIIQEIKKNRCNLE